jgi:hypothetical protein
MTAGEPNPNGGGAGQNSGEMPSKALQAVKEDLAGSIFEVSKSIYDATL